jgi:glycosyltransferase involved in cell wall biosynthesis
MNIAVLSCTRDRLEYTKHCFGTLLEHAGCDFDWWITDQGSDDDTVDWLLANTDATVTSYSENIGICPALNLMLSDALDSADYDVIVKFDNDCELLTPNTLRDVCEASLENNAIVSPVIHGLREPPEIVGSASRDMRYRIHVTRIVGGIFMATPAWMFKQGYRHPETTPLKDSDDSYLCRAYQMIGGTVGYLDGYHANHYETTDGQWARYPEYFARRNQERIEAGMVPA